MSFLNAFFDSIVRLDLKLFYLINHAKLGVLDKILPIFSDETLIRIFYLVTGLILWKKFSLKKCARIWFVLVVGYLWVDFSSSKILKPIFKRERPFLVNKDLYYYSNQKFNYLEQPVIKKTSYAFPSGHASNVGFASLYLGLFYKRFLPLWTGFTLMVGWSRIYLGHHYPLDVIGGYVWGFLWALITYKLVHRFIPSKIPYPKP